MAIPLLKIIELCAPLAGAAVRLLEHRRANYRQSHDTRTATTPSLEQRLTELERADIEMAEVLTTLSQRLEQLAQAAADAALRAEHERKRTRIAVMLLGALTIVGWSTSLWLALRGP